VKEKIPAYIEEVLDAQVAFGRCQIAEVATINPNGEPETFPVYTTYDKERRKIIFNTSIAFTRKIRNIESNPRVAVLFSNMVVTSLRNFPIILVQGKAKKYDPDPSVLTYLHQKSEEVRRKFDWYMIRVRVEVTPEKIYVWKNRNLDEEPETLEVESND
jgi:pyridoxine/pyridoxamine 5'-phosphate oxidase